MSKRSTSIPKSFSVGPMKIIKEPTPMGEPKPTYTAAEPTKEINVGTIEEPLILRIGTKMDMEEEERTVNLLREYKDVFAGNMDEIPGIDPSIACHKLEINKNVRPFKQRIRKIATTYHSQIEVELQKMLEAGIIREAKYPEWIANMVIVPKKNK